MKTFTKFLIGIILMSIAFKASSQDTIYQPLSVYRCGIHYIVLFKFDSQPDTIKIKRIRLRYSTDEGKDSVAYDTLKLSVFKGEVLLLKETADGTEQLTDYIPHIFVLSQGMLFLNFLSDAYDKLCNQSKKVFEKPSMPARTLVNGHTEHWIPAVKRSDGSFWMVGNENKGGPGDTIVLSGNYTYAYVSQDYSSEVVIYTDGKPVSFKNGINIENTNNLKIDGSGGSSFYGITVNGGGTNLSICGKSNHIDIGYIDMKRGRIGGIFDKTEVSDVQYKYDCDPSYLWPTRATFHRLHHLRLYNVQGDGIYEGSTGSTGGRPMECGGTVSYPKPMGVGSVEIDNVILDSINRQAIQVGGADSGYVLVHDNTVTNAGYEYNPEQGAGINIGSLTKNAKVYKNIIRHTFLYNFYSYGDGKTEFYDNVTDTAGQVGTKGTVGWKKNSAQIAATLFAPGRKGSSLNIHDNVTGYNSAIDNGKPVGYVVYGNTNRLDVGGNVFCNNEGNFVNNTGVPFKTQCVGVITYSIAVSSDPNIDINPDGVVTVTQGESKTFSITAKNGYSIADVKVDGKSIGAATSYTFSNVIENHTIEAFSSVITYSVTASVIGGGTITPPGSTIVNKGDSIVYTIQPSIGYSRKRILVDGAEKNKNLTSYTFRRIAEDHNISATFEKNIYVINASAANNGIISPAGKINVEYGESQTFIFTATTPGFEVKDVLIDNVSAGSLTQYTFSNVYSNHTIKVLFQKSNKTPFAVPLFNVLFSNEKVTTTLSGQYSTDDDGKIVSYEWQQTKGSLAHITDPSAAETEVRGLLQGSYTFQLTVTDNLGGIGTAEVYVVVNSAGEGTTLKYGIRPTVPGKKIIKLAKP